MEAKHPSRRDQGHSSLKSCRKELGVYIYIYSVYIYIYIQMATTYGGCTMICMDLPQYVGVLVMLIGKMMITHRVSGHQFV